MFRSSIKSVADYLLWNAAALQDTPALRAII